MERPTEPSHHHEPMPSPSSTPMLPPDDDDHSATAAKPLPDLPSHAPPAVDHFEPYRDDPESLEHAPVPASPALQPCRAISAPQPQPLAQPQFPFVPYTDAEPDDSDDVPLAHLYPYPTEAPPSYYVAVQGPYRDTLIQHIPTTFLGHRDEEAGIDQAQLDDGGRTMERVIAMFIIAFALLIISGVLAWQVLYYM